MCDSARLLYLLFTYSPQTSLASRGAASVANKVARSFLPSRTCNVHGFRSLRARTMSAASLLAKDKAARRATLEVVARESGRNLLGKDAGMRRASAETRRAAVAVGEQLIAKSSGRSDESAWLKAKRLLLAAASGQMVDKGDAAAARRLSHNDPIRPRSAVKKEAQWVLSLAEMDTVKRIASIPAATRAPEETTELLHVLRSSSLFLSLDETTAMALAGALSWQEYEQGEQVFAEDPNPYPNPNPNPSPTLTLALAQP